MAKRTGRSESNSASSVPTRRDAQSIGHILTDLLAQRGYAQIKAHEVCQQAWTDIVGEDLANLSRATEAKRGVLQVVVENSVVMQELTFRKAELIKAMGATLPQHHIKGIRFKIGLVS